jgi:hypothetical protein
VEWGRIEGNKKTTPEKQERSVPVVDNKENQRLERGAMEKMIQNQSCSVC